MIDRLLALIAFALLVAFCSVLLYFVQRLDLGIVIVSVLLMAAYDLLFAPIAPHRASKQDPTA